MGFGYDALCYDFMVAQMSQTAEPKIQLEASYNCLQ